MNRPSTSITMYPWKPPQSFFPTLNASQGNSSTSTSSSSAPVSNPSKANKRSVSRVDIKKKEERRRLPMQARDVLTTYFDNDTEYPSQRQKHDLLSLIRSIPGAEWYTEDKLSSWFVNRRAYQRKREEEEEEGGDPFVRPGQRGPGRSKGSRNKESVVHVMSSSNILWPTLDEIKICKLMILYRENPEPNEQILEVWSRALKAEQDDVHNWVQMSRVEGQPIVEPIINPTSNRGAVRDGASTLPLVQKLMVKNSLNSWKLKKRRRILGTRTDRYLSELHKARLPPFVEEDSSLSRSASPSPIAKSPTPADRPPVVPPLLSTQGTSKTVRQLVTELSATLSQSINPFTSSATLEESEGPFARAESPPTSFQGTHDANPPRRNLLAELAVFVDEKLSRGGRDANISEISVEEFEDSWRASEAFFEKIKSGAYSSQGLVFRVNDDES